MKFLRYIIFLLPLMLMACGYGFGNAGHSVLARNFRTITITKVENPTMQTWLEPRIRKLLRDELGARSNITWTDDREEADAFLEFKIVKYYRPTAVEGEDDDTLRSTARFEFQAVIKSAVDSHVVWASGTINQSWPFYSGQESEADKEVTRLGIRRLADRLSQNY
ncbi:LPS assembly lipoprotein LptE [Pseudodesulfovibrio piezophilus]|uniref:Lipoprotein n=1 Tax=Pseudodesulfovibrio piezophilus (strain DSM 21447 / JCM 15486 / C1TLV30) TaxID=1322246 RepID=M1WY06_PSEP2|nr:LPS assembly lipoprotein LptE [Pseudodesulfovibrio piezophilus]CCH50043.1 conserved exported protein of unknown function [Pseudodesulfovibrio piezophilus C1TLV30]